MKDIKKQTPYLESDTKPELSGHLAVENAQAQSPNLVLNKMFL